MAFHTPTASIDWPLAPSFTAQGETDLRLINPTAHHLYYITTNSDVPPDLAVRLADVIQPGGRDTLTLADGTRLWPAYPDAPNGVSLTFTIHEAEV